ncbi:hypothetical protein CONLIGDRAFT_416825 [Coniochaeta ligniaria NRRL 30616]|uniref:ARM repeat-containing protein n=1 Tax=Coniochaeta ligniaria NRRL 30616 TaxID=1408157 RepID=A0A1J7JBP2_9PEZI|nr:hypothetical protein CONLIGDRAFT_416825 [Coniochaeta ligniaria NRRL 30616]
MSSAKKARQDLVRSLAESAHKAFGPNSSPEVQREANRDLDDLIQRTGTLSLISALNFLVRPDNAPPWLRSELVAILAKLPLRPDGVRGTLEFVFAVHPSSTVQTSEAATPQKRGANITHEALSLASTMLSVPPKRVTPEVWFSGVAPQLLKLLDGNDGPELTKVAAYVIGFGILGRKEFGAPGSPGWKYLAEPMLCQLNPSLSNDYHAQNDASDSNGIVDLSQDPEIVSSDQLTLAVRRLKTLVVSHPNPSLCKRLLRQVLLPLWTISSWSDVSTKTKEELCSPALDLLKIFLRLGITPELIHFIIRNLTYTGTEVTAEIAWSYKATADGALHIVAPRPSLGHSTQRSSINLGNIDTKLTLLQELLEATASDLDISSVFLELFKTWLAPKSRARPGQILIQEEDDKQDEDPLIRVIEIKCLQSMMEKLPSKVVSRSDHALELASQILSDSEATTGGEESIPVALSLLNLVITAPSFTKAKVSPDALQLLETSLDRLARANDSDVAGTARNLALLLRYRDEVEEMSTTMSGPTERQIEDRKTYNLAISYIGQLDSPPPVRAEGLNLISTLIQAHSPVLDIPAVLVLMSTLLSDEEDYINLKVIKIFTQLADRHPKSVVQELLDHYVDANEKASLNTRLRFGEAVTQVIERLGETFTGEVAQNVANALLSIAGRRGHRPKTEAKQAREERARKLKRKEGEDAWGGEVPDLEADETEEEKARNEIIARIVEGWESKRGTEDVRIRASALSIFAAGMETNIAGLGSSAVSTAVDLCTNILTVETEMEKGILRRAAVLLILDFVRALDKAKQERRRLGFSLTGQSREDIMRILEYVADVDNDGLVKQHAKDVVESLQNWEMASFVPDSRDLAGPTLTRLAGLSVNPELSQRSETWTGSRPRIEEIE